MSTQLKHRRGTTEDHASFIGAIAEFTYDTDKKVIVIHDGESVGGFEMLRADMSNVGIRSGEDVPALIRGITNAIGTFNEDYDSEIDGEITSISVSISEPIKAGTDIKIFNYETGEEDFLTVDGDEGETYGAGSQVILPIEADKIDIKAGDPILISPNYSASQEIFSPEKIVTTVESYKSREGGIGKVLSSILNTDTNVTEINVQANQEGDVEGGKEIFISNRNGDGQFLTVDGDQTITTGGYLLQVEPFNPDRTYVSLSSFLTVPQLTYNTSITQTRNEFVIKATLDGNEIESMAQVALKATASSGSSLLLQADNIKVVGQANFLEALDDEGYTTAGDTQTFTGTENDPDVIPYADLPTTRSNGKPLQAGDIAFDANQGDTPYKYNGAEPYDSNDWNRAYTVIRGGDVTTGTLFAKIIEATGQIGYGEVVSGNFQPTVRINEQGVFIADTDNTDGQIKFYDGLLGGPNSEVDMFISAGIWNIQPVSSADVIIGEFGGGAFTYYAGSNSGSFADRAVLTYGQDFVGIGRIQDVGSLQVADASVYIKSTNSTNPSEVSKPMRLDVETTTTATAGSNGDVPSQVDGYIRLQIGGTLKRIPFYND